MTMFNMVGQFHTKFGLPTAYKGPPRWLSPEELEFRIRFIREELDEYLEGVLSKDMAKAADALVDLVYVVLGTAHFHAFPFDEIFAEVQRANMAKERSSGDSDPRSKRGSSLDVVKPVGWTPPDVEGILRRYSCG